MPSKVSDSAGNLILSSPTLLQALISASAALMTSMRDMENSARELERAATNGFEDLQRWALEVSASSRNPLAIVFVNCIKTSVGPALDEWEGELLTRLAYFSDFIVTCSSRHI